MRYLVIALLLWIAGSELVCAADAATNSDAASAEVAPLLAEMGAAANAHDVDRHVGFYAHDDSVVFIFNGEPTIGWEAIRQKQREVWRNGTSDVVYTMQGRPTFLMPAPGLVVTTIYLKSRRTIPNGQIAVGEFAVSSLWQKRPEGWRVIYSHESTTR
ncbi:MAG: nuclear transport factor 2 family protein [Steroidobacteraceae bacterium]